MLPHRSRYAYRPVGPPVVGGFLDTVGDVVSWPFKTAASAVDDFVNVVPGGGWVKSAFDQGKTWLGDMARDPWGGRVLWAITSGLTPGLALVVGPQIATVLWALPGYLRGECVGEAYVKELTSRVVMLAQVYGSQAIPDEVAKQVTNLVQNSDFLGAVNLDAVNNAKAAAAQAGVNLSTSDALKKLGASPNQIAARFNVRADAAALASSMVLCENVYDTSSYDPLTGTNPNDGFVVPVNQPGGLPRTPNADSPFLPLPPLPAGATSADVLTAILDAQKAGVDDSRLVNLKAQFQSLLASEDAGTSEATQAAADARLAAAHGRFFASPLFPAPPATPPGTATTTPSLLVRLLTVAGLTAPFWGTVLYLRRRRA